MSMSRSGLESSTAELDSDAEDFESSKVKRNKSKASRASRPTPNKAQPTESGRSVGSNFLTAAEQRENDKKTEKKTTEDPFEFLRDVRDVRESNYR